MAKKKSTVTEEPNTNGVAKNRLPVQVEANPDDHEDGAGEATLDLSAAPVGIVTNRRVHVVLRGLPPGLLMSSKSGMSMDEGVNKAAPVLRSGKEQAELSAYWCDADGKRALALPWFSLYKAIVAAAARYKFRGRETMRDVVAASICAEADMIPLCLPNDDKKPKLLTTYKHDARWGRIPPRTGGVVLLNRAHVPEWEARFYMLVDDEFFKVDHLKAVLATAGKLVGVCAFRPQKQGPYGKFFVHGWEIEK